MGFSCYLVSARVGPWQRVCPQTAHKTGAARGWGAGLMPWVEKRPGTGGRPRYAALYRDPTGAKRSAGTLPLQGRGHHRVT
jgi:hypothetical protein